MLVLLKNQIFSVSYGATTTTMFMEYPEYTKLQRIKNVLMFVFGNRKVIYANENTHGMFDTHIADSKS